MVSTQVQKGCAAAAAERNPIHLAFMASSSLWPGDVALKLLYQNCEYFDTHLCKLSPTRAFLFLVYTQGRGDAEPCSPAWWQYMIAPMVQPLGSPKALCDGSLGSKFLANGSEVSAATVQRCVLPPWRSRASAAKYCVCPWTAAPLFIDEPEQQICKWVFTLVLDPLD